MRFRNLGFGASFLMVATASTAAVAQPAAPAARVPPASRWVVDTTGASCIASRELAGPFSSQLVIRHYPGSGGYALVLASREWRRLVRSRNAEIVVGTARRQQETRLVLGLPGGGVPTLRFGFSSTFLQEFGRATSVIDNADGARIAEFPLPQAASVARVLGDCEKAFLAEWGADPAGLEEGARRPEPIGEEHKWLPLDDLFSRSRMGVANNILARLTIGTDGRVQTCTIIESSLDEPRRTAACQGLIASAHYQPARDRNGNAVRSVAVYDIGLLRRIEFQTTVVPSGRTN
jgi:hypothetical protein